MTEPAAGTDDHAAPGGAPDGQPELGDQVAEQAATGISSPDADEHAGQEAPASEGELPG